MNKPPTKTSQIEIPYHDPEKNEDVCGTLQLMSDGTVLYRWADGTVSQGIVREDDSEPYVEWNCPIFATGDEVSMEDIVNSYL